MLYYISRVKDIEVQTTQFQKENKHLSVCLSVSLSLSLL